MKYTAIALILINALGFLLMLIDKYKAKKRRWRIPESVLLGTAVCGGSIGVLLGMLAFRHKTRHIKFSAGVPLILLAHIVIATTLKG